MKLHTLSRAILQHLGTWPPNDIGWPVFMRGMPYKPGHEWKDRDA